MGLICLGRSEIRSGNSRRFGNRTNVTTGPRLIGRNRIRRLTYGIYRRSSKVLSEGESEL